MDLIIRNEQGGTAVSNNSYGKKGKVTTLYYLLHVAKNPPCWIYEKSRLEITSNLTFDFPLSLYWLTFEAGGEIIVLACRE